MRDSAQIVRGKFSSFLLGCQTQPQGEVYAPGAAPAGQPTAAVQEPVNGPQQRAAVENPVNGQRVPAAVQEPVKPAKNPYEKCVDAALVKAEQCLLAKDAMICKSESEQALEVCKRLS